MIDGVGHKYRNFGKQNTGMTVVPLFGASVVRTLPVWVANDAPERDPVSFERYGANQVDTGTDSSMSEWALIAAGDLSLPLARQAGGSAPLLEGNSVTVSWANTTCTTSECCSSPP